jgi:hypothetical protein
MSKNAATLDHIKMVCRRVIEMMDAENVAIRQLVGSLCGTARGWLLGLW